VHWSTGKIDLPSHLIERDALSKIKELLKTKFIIILKGLRRVGKSVIARQIMHDLLIHGVKATKICWFEFDRSMAVNYEQFNELLYFFKTKEPELVVLDEIHFVQGWQDALKLQYDLSNTKFIVTGSSALDLDRRSAESLAGRFMIEEIHPFSFSEFLQLKGFKQPKDEFESVAFEHELINNCEDYVKIGGLPEAIDSSEELRKDYLKKAIVDVLFFKDTPAVFPNSNPEQLSKALEILSSNPCSLFHYQTLAQLLSISTPTATNQVDILEKMLLVRSIHNYSGSVLKQRRKSKKIIFTDNGILSVLNPSVPLGVLVENAVGYSINATHFWRDLHGREIDFILPEKKLAIEVKYQSHITSSDEKHLKYFLERNAGWTGILITKNHISNGSIKHIPLWNWFLKPSM
ncbi:ATP-binding protein, partial [Candidatus Micrarchaeota archaeon]|nr:ATP-binding protein [Candidatus Micrarchaeota archaeon]